MPLILLVFRAGMSLERNVGCGTLAAGEASDVADIFSEVDEEVRRDQAQALWARYGNHAIAGALLVLLGIAAFWGWQKYQEHRQLQAAEAYAEAIRTEGAKSQEMLSRIASEGGGFAVLARLNLAADALSAGDPHKAKGIFAEIAADPAVDPALSGLAAVKAALLELEAGNADRASALVADLDKEGQPYRLSALEIIGLAALQSGDRAKAREIFSQLRDLASGAQGLPAMEARAEQLLDRLAE